MDLDVLYEFIKELHAKREWLDQAIALFEQADAPPRKRRRHGRSK